MKRLLVALALTGVVLTAGVAAATAATDYSHQVATTVRSGVQHQLSTRAQASLPGMTIVVAPVRCVQLNNSESYQCLVNYTGRYEGSTLVYRALVDANLGSNGYIIWHTVGTPQRVN